jgi:D-serine deaminase-like pyridoxal phosphate-dependent protein
MQRRHFLFALAAAAAGGALLRPADRGAPHDDYFTALNDLLKQAGTGTPSLVIDLDRLDRNCARLREHMPAGKQYRIVAKSLPSTALIAHVAAQTGSTRVMGFHQPFLNAVARDFPATDLLLGKPMPVQAAATFYARHAPGQAFDPSRQLQWLVDTPERLAQYAQLARTLGTRVRVNVEIDVGLHRGGLQRPEQLDALLEAIAADTQHLELAGFMGYDAHVGKIPAVLESRDESLAKSLAIYRGFLDRLAARAPQLATGQLTLNGAGSPTFRLHGDKSPLNDISAGSVLVKPTDFDLPLLEDFEPAAFIATPVLKAMDGLQLPGSDLLGKAWALWDRNRRRTFFIYGGRWMARHASPPGLSDNGLYGASSNQAIVNAAQSVNLTVDDHIFLRPTQSEAVLLQFGDIVAVRGGRIAARWPVLPAPASAA